MPLHIPPPPTFSPITCVSLTNGDCHGNISMATWRRHQSGSSQLSRENLGNVCLVGMDDNSLNHWKKLKKRRQWDEALALFSSIVSLLEFSRFSFLLLFVLLHSSVEGCFQLRRLLEGNHQKAQRFTCQNLCNFSI